MLNIYVVGRNEMMGKLTCELINQSEDMVVIGGYDCHHDSKSKNFEVEESNSDINLDNVDVIIDFSCPEYTVRVVKAAVKSKVPMVIETAGFTDEQECIIEKASKVIPIFRRANYCVAKDAFAQLLTYVADDTTNLTHRTEILTVFVKGAINCAKFLANTRDFYFVNLRSDLGS